jgi:16S rRNA (uracil1498-N3)-methyltransferase
MSSDEHKNLIRLYVSRETLSRGENAELSEGQLHYLRNVMRLNPSDKLRVFNGRNGEWLAELAELSKKKAVVTLLEKLREQQASSDIAVFASPVKKEAFDFMVEKSCELGAVKFLPVQCARTVVQRVNIDRLQALSNEAAEQSERLDSMEIYPLAGLKEIFPLWTSPRQLIFCMERGENIPGIVPALEQYVQGTPLALLVGPEGGFTEEEVRYITSFSFVQPVTLGPRILKAETALIAALACINAYRG